MATLKFKTGFEDATKIGTPGQVGEKFSFPAPYQTYPTTTNGFVYGTAIGNSWIETAFAHTGSKCAGFQRASNSDRMEWNVWSLDQWVGQEIFVREWVFLPADFDIINGWDNIIVFFGHGGNGLPTIELGMRKDGNVCSLYFSQILVGESPHVPIPSIPTGRWFPLQWHVVRSTDPNVGRIEVWFDAQYPDPPTMTWFGVTGTTASYWYMTPAKCYGDQVAQTGRKIWLDDIEVWDGLPSGGNGGTYALTVQASNGGAVNVESQDFPAGTPVQVTATPYTDYKLDYWLLDGNNVGNANPYTVTMDVDHTLKPVFALSPTPTENAFPWWLVLIVAGGFIVYRLGAKKW